MLRDSSKKRLADELARQICRHGADEFARLFSFTGLMAGHAADPSKATVPSAPQDGRIGIWRKDEHTQEFVRDVDLAADWPYWTQLPSFPVNSARRRVLLVGESAARGMFYDPAFTPAQALGTLLQRELGQEAVEVLDLARTNATAANLREVTSGSLQLQPDAVVIFAGNNWMGNRSYQYAGDYLYELADGFHAHGAAGFRSRLEQLVLQEVVKLVDEVGATYRAAGIPVYWVIPEFNLLDWRDPAINCPWLHGEDENRQWSDLRRLAEQLLRDKQFPRAQQAAESMLALDGGHCSTTLHLLADCHGAQGKQDLQREYLEKARDAAIVDSVRSYTPRITTLVRDTLQRQLAATGQKFVDLKELFANYLQGGIPGRRLFLDYCHLTGEGIGVSMAEVARRLLVDVFGKNTEARSSSEPIVFATDKVEADACLLAAIHNAHWGQSLEVVTHYCMRAVEKSADVLPVMRAFVDIQNRRAPTWMNGKVVELLDSMSSQVKRYLFSMEFKVLDRLLFTAFETCCRQHDRSLGEELAAIRQEQHSVRALGKVDVLDPYYHSTSFSNQQLIEGGLDQRSDFLRAYDQVSDFCFVADKSEDLTLSVTLRLRPWARPDTEVDFRVNGQRLMAVKAASDWTSTRLEIPRTLLSSGINEIQVIWPGLAKTCRAPVEQICSDIQRHHTPPLYPSYGDIYTMTIQAADNSQARP